MTKAHSIVKFIPWCVGLVGPDRTLFGRLRIQIQCHLVHFGITRNYMTVCWLLSIYPRTTPSSYARGSSTRIIPNTIQNINTRSPAVEDTMSSNGRTQIGISTQRVVPEIQSRDSNGCGLLE